MKTVSEIFFEQFLIDNGLRFKPVPVEFQKRRPDYIVEMPSPVMFEVKELVKDKKFNQNLHNISHRTVGDHIRKKITDSKDQVQYGRMCSIPSVMLIYNALDPLHLFGTEDHDFRAAINGEWTLWLSKESKDVAGAGYGANRSLQPRKNTSFSALAHMAPRGSAMTVRLFLNSHAAFPLAAKIPACFKVVEP